MTKLEPGQRKGPRTRRRWFFLALVVGSALAVLVVGTLFGVLGESRTIPEPPQPTVRSAPHPTAPVVQAPASSAPRPVVRAPAAPSGDGANQPREITTQGPDGTTTTVVTSDGTVTSTTTTPAAPN